MTSKTILSAAILLMALIPFLFISSCQKEEPLMMDSDSISVNQLKSGTISTADIEDLILKIENYVISDHLKPGIANSFVSKLSNSKKSLEKGNEKAAVNQLNALQNQLEGLIYAGTIDASMGGGLILDIQEITGEWTYGQPFFDYRDGTVYQTVGIGEQCWMAGNLAFDIGEGCWVDENNESYLETYGRLYSWEAANAACPAGWHLPGDAEWEQLAQYISGEEGPYSKLNDDWPEVGKHLKATSGWNSGGNGTDDFGFSALPGGSRYFSALPGRYSDIYGIFDYVGLIGDFWSSTGYGSIYAWYRHLNYGNPNFCRAAIHKAYGFSVRCVRD